MPKVLKTCYIISAVTILAISASILFFQKEFRYPFPAVKLSPVSEHIILDLTSVLSGVRRLGADIAWVQLLQYYGSPEKPVDKEKEYELSLDTTRHILGLKPKEESGNGHAENHYNPQIAGGGYTGFLNYCLRIVDLDPYFSYVYLYGSGALAWNLNRGDEALVLLKRGIESMERYKENITSDLHRPYWRFNLYVSAIIYRKRGESEKMISLLDTAARQPEAPNVVKVILANIYQNAKKYGAALELWKEIRQSGDPSYFAKSGDKIKELNALLTQRQ